MWYHSWGQVNAVEGAGEGPGAFDGLIEHGGEVEA